VSVPSFSYTQHAVAMLAEREIDRNWVEQTILHPDETEPDPRHPDRHRSFRAIPERDVRVLRVVYVQSGMSDRVITLFLDRGRRR
jgi:hypothetical protein